MTTGKEFLPFVRARAASLAAIGLTEIADTLCELDSAEMAWARSRTGNRRVAWAKLMRSAGLCGDGLARGEVIEAAKALRAGGPDAPALIRRAAAIAERDRADMLALEYLASVVKWLGPQSIY